MQFVEFPKISRLTRECVVTEKIDGINASIFIEVAAAFEGELPSEFVRWGEYVFGAGSRTRWIAPGKTDNHAFAYWAHTNKEELITVLGPGHHFGEWWGSGIQRGYGLQKGDKRFSLFNTSRWNEETKPKCCSVVPILYQGLFDTHLINGALTLLGETGSKAAPGFMKPEGVVIYHVAGNLMFKKTLEKDEMPKSVVAVQPQTVGA